MLLCLLLTLQADVEREKIAFVTSAKIIRSQAKNIESKTWWLTR